MPVFNVLTINNDLVKKIKNIKEQQVIENSEIKVGEVHDFKKWRKYVTEKLREKSLISIRVEVI